MLSGKSVSLETIVERVHRDYGFTVDTDWTDIAEWIGSVIDLINAPMQYTERITDGHDKPYINIVNGRGLLPCDLIRVVQTRTCEGIPMRYSTDSFHKRMHSAQCPDLICSSDLTYKLNDNYIFTNFSTGKIEMAYMAFPTDERGYPTVPDDEKFKQAATAYVAERIAFKLYLRDKIDERKYERVNKERLWYIAAAQTKALIPDRDKTRSIANQFRRIVSFEDEHATGYKSSSNMQILRNQTSFRNGNNNI
jgi:hypothetical protein